MIYNEHTDIMTNKKKQTTVVLLISYIFTKAAKDQTSNGGNLEKCLGGIRIYFVIHLQLKSVSYQKRLDSCQVLLACK